MSAVRSRRISGRGSLIISFLSGKGGAGKTSVSLGIGKLLSSIGYKVLFVDLDLHTHGASYFFTDMCEAQHKKGILELLQEVNRRGGPEEAVDVGKVLVKVSENFDFVPSKKVFKEKTWELLQNTSLVSRFINRCIRRLKELDYDFVIVDTQAGPAASTREVCKQSKKVLIVSEPDPISVAASRSLDYEIHEILPEFTRFLVNKLNTEEIQSFRAIKDYLTIFEHLSPLPFDFGVRKAFSLRKIPVDIEVPSPFLFGLISLAGEIIHTAAGRLEKLEAKVRKSAFGEIREKKDRHTVLIDELSAKMEGLRDSQMEHEVMFKKRIAAIMSAAIITATAMFTVLVFSRFRTEFDYPLRTKYLPTYMMIITVGIVISTLPIAYAWLGTKLKTRKRSIDFEIESMQEKLQSLRREKEKYEALLLEKSERFMVEPD